MRPTRVTLMIQGDWRDRYIPKKYLCPGIRLIKEDGSYYTILNDKREISHWNMTPLDNGEFAGIDGTHISIEIDQEPVKGEIVWISKALCSLIFV